MGAERRIVLAGGSGYLGGHLARRLNERGDEVVVLTRGDGGVRDGVRYVTWDGERPGPWSQWLDGAHAVVNLAGRRVDVRPTRGNVRSLTSSRTLPTAALGAAVEAVASPPAVWVQVATMAIYGDAGDDLIDESVPVPTTGPAQMTGVATAWEEAYTAATARVGRSVLLRCGVAIGPGDPASAHLAFLARIGFGGRIGSGRQWVSWIALEDLMRVIERGVDDPTMQGTYHVTSPEPVRNRELMARVRAAVGRRRGLPTPALAVHAGTWLLGSDPALPLTGRRGHPGRLAEEGFVFCRPTIADALAAAVRR